MRSPYSLKHERVLFHKYEDAAVALGKEQPSGWETLFNMQHYYIPTRLLDWTGVLGVAIFFATLKDFGKDHCIYILDPQALNEVATGIPEIKRRDSENFDYKKIYWDRKGPILPKAPIAMEPPFLNPRLLAQKGKFTIHNDRPTPLDEQCPDCVIPVTLPRSARPGALEFLRYANLNHFSMFPDIDGLAPFIKTDLEID
jgi:hypothetical protein